MRYRQKRSGGSPQAVLTIPVVVHIIHQNGRENISDAEVIRGIAHLNDAFRNRNFFTKPNGADVEIEFCLAIRDPSGKTTTGINRIVSPITDLTLESQDIAMKSLSRW